MSARSDTDPDSDECSSGEDVLRSLVLRTQQSSIVMILANTVAAFTSLDLRRSPCDPDAHP